MPQLSISSAQVKTDFDQCFKVKGLEKGDLKFSKKSKKTTGGKIPPVSMTH
jgi:hypothetical protein